MDTYLVSYAFDDGHGLKIRDARLSAGPLTDRQVETMRAHLVGVVHTNVSIIAITKLETP